MASDEELRSTHRSVYNLHPLFAYFIIDLLPQVALKIASSHARLLHFSHLNLIDNLKNKSPSELKADGFDFNSIYFHQVFPYDE